MTRVLFSMIEFVMFANFEAYSHKFPTTFAPFLHQIPFPGKLACVLACGCECEFHAKRVQNSCEFNESISICC